MEHKALTAELPEASESTPEGSVRAQFSVFNEVDHDNDVTIPGAFKNGQSVRMASYGHKLSELPVGKGNIFADDKRSVFNGRFFTNTTVGQDTYLTVKEMGDLQQWSYEYDVLAHEFGTWKGQPVRFLKSLDVHGVTPVYLGAGSDTGTLDIKSFTADGEELEARVVEYITRAKDRATIRAKEGRTLSSANRNRLSALVESLGSVQDEIRKLLEDSDPEAGKESLQLELKKLLRTEAKINGVLQNV